MPANLNRKQQREIKAVVERAKKDNGIPQTAQQSIPFQRMFPDGICRVTDSYYTKTIQFQDINYQLAQQEDKTAIFDEWCSFLNFFDSSVQFELSFMNMSTDAESFEKSIRIPFRKDNFNSSRAEYSQILKKQLSQGNNGLTKTKYLTFGIEAESMRQAKPRLNHIENDLLNNFRRLGVMASTMNGKERLRLMHSMFHMGDNDKFFFDWKYLVESGLSVKDFIAPTAFAFQNSRTFQMGSIYGSMSYLQIIASDLSDRMLADFLDMESSQIVTMHIQSVDQTAAIKTIKRTITELDRSKIEEQKKAVRSGYDMDIIPSDLATYGKDAKALLKELQSQNERMFMLTFLVMNTGRTEQELENNAPRFVHKQIQLNRRVPGYESEGRNAHGTNRVFPLVVLHEQDAGCLRDLQRALCGKGHPALLGKAVVDVALPDVDTNTGCSQTIPAKLVPHILCQLQHHLPHLLRCLKVLPAGDAVTDALDAALIIDRHDRRTIQTIGVSPQRGSVLSEQLANALIGIMRKVTNGEYTPRHQLTGGAVPNIQKFRHGQRPDTLFPVFRGEYSHRIGLFHVAAQLCQHLAEGYPDGNREAEFLFDGGANLMRDFLGIIKGATDWRNIDPALIHAKRFNPVGVSAVDRPGQLGILAVLVILRRDNDQSGAGPSRFPVCHTGFDTSGLGLRAGGQHDAMSLLCTAANCDGLVLELRVQHLLHTCVELVHIDMQNLRSHGLAPRLDDFDVPIPYRSEPTTICYHKNL